MLVEEWVWVEKVVEGSVLIMLVSVCSWDFEVGGSAVVGGSVLIMLVSVCSWDVELEISVQPVVEGTVLIILMERGLEEAF